VNPEQILRDQAGVAWRPDLVAAGWTNARMDRMVSLGELRTVRRGWIATPGAHPLVLAAATIGGAVTCTSELRRRGLFVPNDSRLHLAVAPNASRLRQSDGVQTVVHWGQEVVARPRGAVFDPLDNVLIHLAQCLPTDWAVAAIDSVAHEERRFTAAHVHKLAARTHSQRLKGLLPLLDFRAESGLESLLRVRLSAAGIAMIPQAQIGRFRVDGLIGERLVIEAAGYEFHSERADFESDHVRAADLQLRGYLVLQFTYQQIVNDWPRVLETIRAHIARGDHRWDYGRPERVS